MSSPQYCCNFNLFEISTEFTASYMLEGSNHSPTIMEMPFLYLARGNKTVSKPSHKFIYYVGKQSH